LYLLAFIGFIFMIYSAFANTYIGDVYFTVSDTVYITGERIELSGAVKIANYTNNGTLISNSTFYPNALVNLTITNTNGTYSSNQTFTTDSNGKFFSRNNHHSSATLVNAPSLNGAYYLKAEYIDPNNTTWYSYMEIRVVNETVDELKVKTNKVEYRPSQSMKITAEAIRTIGDKTIKVANVSVNGSIRNSTTIISTFNCTTENNGKCHVSKTAPASYGQYDVELNNYKTFSSFFVGEFQFSIYMKDDLGKSLKNVYAQGESGRVEVSIINTSSSDIYTFSGYISDSGGNVVKAISSTALNSNNSFINSFLFLTDSTIFNLGTYTSTVTISRSGGGSTTVSAPFEVRNWELSISKKSSSSGFEYGYSAFQNRTVRFEAIPKYRANGTIIANVTAISFNISLKDNLNNIIGSANAVWNSSCGKEGCYEIPLLTPNTTGKYNFVATLSYEGDAQTQSQIINVISGALSAQSTNSEGSLKDLFGTNEYAYMSLTVYNETSYFNLSDAEVFIVSYMNGSEFSYSQLNNWSSVNSSNSNYEWAWNSTLQRIKLDVPKIGGLYEVFIFGNNRTMGTNGKFIVNPYDVCTTPKSVAGQTTYGYQYVWQFKKTDTIYFELKATLANNPLGKASADNSSGSSNNTYGMGSACSINTQTQQIVSNATITIEEIRNEFGSVQDFNLSGTSCQSSDNSGGYSCTVPPLSKWEGGQNIVKFKIQGQDGTVDYGYGRFEARAFYIYGWSNVWQNSPSSNISLNVRLYEPGNNYWSASGSSGGLSGTITLKRIEYQGRDGEWIWPPVDSGYNVSNVSSASVTGGSASITIPSSLYPGGQWKTGYYRAILQGTTTNGDTDYGYAWFGVKLWDVYGTPIECNTNGCNYKWQFNSKENITLYVKISQAGDYSYDYNGGQNIYGNVTVSVKKIQDCRSWPCKELNSSQYTATSINVNSSSPWYWSSSITNYTNYMIGINTTSGTWNTGYYNVVLDVNGTDTGNAWFSAIAFYAEAQSTDSNGTNYIYSIRNNKPMYINLTTTKSYKYGNWYYNNTGSYYVRYNQSDYVNTTIVDGVLRTWDQTTYQQKEYNYPEQINLSVTQGNNLSCFGNCLINITYLNGSWPTGYYNGELTMNNSDGETSTGYLWFEARPFRVQINSNSYNVDADQCVNGTIYIYEPSWYNPVELNGTYSISSVYEDNWNGMSQSRTLYTNYTNTTFNSSVSANFCPNSGSWGSGSWGGYHSLNVVVSDNSDNSTSNGYIWFKAVPFQVSWNGASPNAGSYQGTTRANANVNVTVNVTRPTSSTSVSGNLTSIYQWRCDDGPCVKETYRFIVRNSANSTLCDSSVSGQCNASYNGVTIYAPSSGWKTGYNYLYTTWTAQDNPSSTVEDQGGIYFNALEAYNGYFNNIDTNGNWKWDFRQNENITVKIYVRDLDYNAVDATITNVYYASSSSTCWDERCRTYTTATWSLVGGGTSTSGGNAIIRLHVPGTNWSKGDYYIKADVSGGSGTGTIKGGYVRVKNSVPLNITSVNTPINNGTYNTSLLFNFTTNRDSECNLYINNFDNFYGCYGWASAGNSSNGTVLSSQKLNACNTTLYGYNGTRYYYEYVSSTYHSVGNGTDWSSCWTSPSSGTSCYGTNTGKLQTYISTGGTSHTFTLNLTGISAQHYGMQAWCYDSDYDYATDVATFKINNTGV